MLAYDAFCRCGMCHYNIDVSSLQLVNQAGNAIERVIRGKGIEFQGARADIAEGRETLKKRVNEPGGARTIEAADKADIGQLFVFLRTRHNRPRDRRATKERDELAPPHCLSQQAQDWHRVGLN